MNNKHDISHTECGCGNGNGCCGGHQHGEHHHHDHHHHHGECCCGHKEVKKDDLTQDENDFLNYLLTYTFLPVARFVLKSTKEKDFEVCTLSPVFIEYEDDNLDRVKFMANLLTSLEEKGVISIDYDFALKNYDYSEYYNSDLFKYFEKTVKEGKDKQAFLGDIAELETGSIAITDEYAELLKSDEKSE